VTQTPLSRSKGQRSTCRGRGILWQPPAQLVYLVRSAYGLNECRRMVVARSNGSRTSIDDSRIVVVTPSSVPYVAAITGGRGFPRPKKMSGDANVSVPPIIASFSKKI